MTWEVRLTSCARTASIARSARFFGAAPERTAQVCATESSLPSSFWEDPSGVPSSK